MEWVILRRPGRRLLHLADVGAIDLAASGQSISRARAKPARGADRQGIGEHLAMTPDQ